MTVEEIQAISELVDKIRAVNGELKKLEHYVAGEMFISCAGASCKIELSEADRDHVVTELTARLEEEKTGYIEHLEEHLD